jgi:hypothetical protein
MSCRSYTPRERKVKLICPICGVKFTRHAYYVRNKRARNVNGRICCSPICFHEARWGKDRSGIEWCLHCGRELRVTGARIKRNKHGHFCLLRGCYDEWRRKHMSGENAPAWKGGYFLWRGSKRWHKVREQARRRDNNTCQDCGATKQPWGYKLDVHHRIPECDDLDTLVTLCRPCHVAREMQRRSHMR